MADQPTVFPPVPAYYRTAPRRYWPRVTLTLLVINFVCFGLELLAGGTQNTSVLLNFGAAYGPYLRRGELWRLVMPMFLHGGWLHILGNSYALFILGPILERVYGWGRYALIYVAAGMGGAYLSMAVSKNVSVGASGAIFGVAGAMLVTGYVHRDLIPRRWGRAFGRGMIPFIALNLALGFSMHGIDNWGHLGGLATGALLAFVIPPPRLDDGFGGLIEAPSELLGILPVAIVVLAVVATVGNYRKVEAMDQLLAQSREFESAQQYDREYQSLQAALRLAPKQEQPHEELGRYYLRQRKYDEGIAEYQQAVRLTEGDQQQRLELGIAYELKGDPQKAQQIIEQELGKNPASEQGRNLLAENYVMLADLYAGQKLYREAVTAYQQALRLTPDSAVAHNNLAWLYATCDDPNFRDPRSALIHAQRAVELSQGKQADFLDTLAEAHFVNGQYAEAVDVQKKALSLDPSNTELQKHMARYRQGAR